MIKFERLKQRLSTAVDFKHVFEQFLDDVADAPGFMDLGDRFRDQTLEGVIALAGSSALKLRRPASLEAVKLIRLPEHRFVHGSVQLDRKLGNVFWFEDIGTGLLALLVSRRHSLVVHTRLTIVARPHDHPNRN